MQSSLKKGTTPYFKSERFSLHSQHEMQNYTWTISHSLFYFFAVPFVRLRTDPV